MAVGSAAPWKTALRSNPLFLEIGAGCMAGVVEYTVCQPIDLVATRRMLTVETNAANQRSLIGDLRQLHHEGGIPRMYV